eukprot:gene12516-biopygen8567
MLTLTSSMNRSSTLNQQCTAAGVARTARRMSSLVRLYPAPGCGSNPDPGPAVQRAATNGYSRNPCHGSNCNLAFCTLQSSSTKHGQDCLPTARDASYEVMPVAVRQQDAFQDLLLLRARLR